METTIKLLSVDETAKQIKDLLKAITKIKGVECPLSIRQIKMIIKGIKISETIYITKGKAHISFDEPKENLYFYIIISRWFDEDKFSICFI